MLRGLAVALAACTLAASASGCGDKADAAEIDRNETVPVELTVELKGDLNLSFKGKVESKFIVRRTKNKDENAQRSQVAGTESVNPIRHNGMAFIAGVAILPYTGDRTYAIPVGSPMDALKQAQQSPEAVQVSSSIKVEWFPTGDPAGDGEMFMRRAQPCEAVVKAEGTRGTVTCPDVTNEEQSKHFSLSLSWVAPPRR